MTVSLEHISIQKDYFDLAQREIADLFAGNDMAYGLKRLSDN